MTDPDPTEEIIQPFSTLTTSEEPAQPETDLDPLTDSLRKLLTEEDKPAVTQPLPPPPPFFAEPLPPPPTRSAEARSPFNFIPISQGPTFQQPDRNFLVTRPKPRREGRDFRRRSPSPSSTSTRRDRSRSRDENREEYGLARAKPSISNDITNELRDQLSIIPIYGRTQEGGTEPPPGSPMSSGSSPVWFFGKVMKPYKKHIHSINKDGVLFKTRFGIKKLRNDNKGLYLRQNGKNYYLYTWGEKQQSLLTYK